MRKYGIQKRDDYAKYNRLAGSLRQLAHKLAALEPTDEFRRKHEDLVLEKLFTMGILGTGGSGRGKLSDVEHKVTVSAFCRRRLPVVMTKLRMVSLSDGQGANFLDEISLIAVYGRPIMLQLV